MTIDVPHYVAWSRCPDGREHVPRIQKAPGGRRWICGRKECPRMFGYLPPERGAGRELRGEESEAEARG